MTLATVQQRLGLDADGKWGPDTEGAVIALMDKAGVPPVDLAPAPHRKLSAGIIMAAQASERKYGIPTSVSLAQFAIESAWGTRMPPNSNNPFGIKARTGEPSVTVRTREWSKAKGDYYIEAAFRKFASFDEAFDHHGRLLGTAGVYARARTKLPDPDAFADALTGVYATDPNYGTALKRVMKSQGLYQYNVGGEA